MTMSQSQGSGWPPPPQGQPAPNQDPGWGSAPPGQPGYPSKFCHACGSAIDARAAMCPRCGVQQVGPGLGPGKDRALAVLLALLLGNFGVHRFYLGHIAWGVAYLVFFWTGIPGIIAWFEAIYFLTRSDADWAATYGGPVKAPNGCAIGCLWILALLPLLAIGMIFVLVFIGGQVESILSEIANEI
jgi:TM2 domain-containing membrane protein YozV